MGFLRFSRWNIIPIYTEAATGKKTCSVRKRVLTNFGKFTGIGLCESLFLNKVTGLRSATLLKKRLWHRCFPECFSKFLITPFLQNTSGRLLLFTDFRMFPYFDI